MERDLVDHEDDDNSFDAFLKPVISDAVMGEDQSTVERKQLIWTLFGLAFSLHALKRVLKISKSFLHFSQMDRLLQRLSYHHLIQHHHPL